MKNLKTKDKNPVSAEDRRFGVILEDINKKFGQVLEGQEALNEKFDKKIDNFYSEFKIFEQDTKSSFKSVFEYLSRIDDELKDVKSELIDLRRTLSSKAEVSRLESLEKRVHDMEVKLASYKK